MGRAGVTDPQVLLYARDTLQEVREPSLKVRYVKHCRALTLRQAVTPLILEAGNPRLSPLPNPDTPSQPALTEVALSLHANPLLVLLEQLIEPQRTDPPPVPAALGLDPEPKLRTESLRHEVAGGCSAGLQNLEKRGPRGVEGRSCACAQPLVIRLGVSRRARPVSHLKGT